jgi:phosphatidylglycerophosphate synthase
MNPALRLQRKTYYKLVDVRAIIFNPLVRILAFLKITPDMLSYTGLFLMLLFIFLLRANEFSLAAVLLLLTVLLDNIDGVLARYQKRDSDLGKFKDMVVDNICFSLFIIGLVYAKLLTGLIGLIFVYTMILAKLFRSIDHAFFLKSDWHFKAVAGFLPNLFVGLSYLFFLVLVIFNKNYLDSTSILFSILLAIDAFIFYTKILKQKK